jgi:hypothetical protein
MFGFEILVVCIASVTAFIGYSVIGEITGIGLGVLLLLNAATLIYFINKTNKGN